MTHRTTTLTLLVLSLAECTAVGQDRIQAGSAPALACIQRATMPTYQPLLRQLSIQGTLIAEIKVSANGRVERLRITGDPKLAKLSSLESILLKWEFQGGCAGKLLQVQVKYGLAGRDYCPRSQVTLRYPDSIDVVAKAPTLQE